MKCSHCQRNVEPNWNSCPYCKTILSKDTNSNNTDPQTKPKQNEVDTVKSTTKNRDSFSADQKSFDSNKTGPLVGSVAGEEDRKKGQHREDQKEEVRPPRERPDYKIQEVDQTKYEEMDMSDLEEIGKRKMVSSEGAKVEGIFRGTSRQSQIDADSAVIVERTKERGYVPSGPSINAKDSVVKVSQETHIHEIMGDTDFHYLAPIDEPGILPCWLVQQPKSNKQFVAKILPVGEKEFSTFTSSVSQLVAGTPQLVGYVPQAYVRKRIECPKGLSSEKGGLVILREYCPLKPLEVWHKHSNRGLRITRLLTYASLVRSISNLLKQRNIRHGGIKPENIYVSFNNPKQFQITDFRLREIKNMIADRDPSFRQRLQAYEQENPFLAANCKENPGISYPDIVSLGYLLIYLLIGSKKFLKHATTKDPQGLVNDVPGRRLWTVAQTAISGQIKGHDVLIAELSSAIRAMGEDSGEVRISVTRMLARRGRSGRQSRRR